MNLRRALLCAALAVAATTGLTACQTNVGLAAMVDGQRLTDSQLGGYVEPAAGPATGTDQQGNKQVVYPKQSALEAWVQDRLFDRAVVAHGGPRTKAETSAASAAVLGGSTLADAERTLARGGFTPKYGDLFIDRAAAAVVLIQRLNKGATAQQALSALNTTQAGTLLRGAVLATHPRVTISPRYGSWDAANVGLALSSSTGAPDFIQVGNGGGTAAVPAP